MHLHDHRVKTLAVMCDVRTTSSHVDSEWEISIFRQRNSTFAPANAIALIRLCSSTHLLNAGARWQAFQVRRTRAAVRARRFFSFERSTHADQGRDNAIVCQRMMILAATRASLLRSATLLAQVWNGKATGDRKDKGGGREI
jgi:hypothetical protein